jgi:hypothetical protein
MRDFRATSFWTLREHLVRLGAEMTARRRDGCRSRSCACAKVEIAVMPITMRTNATGF